MGKLDRRAESVRSWLKAGELRKKGLSGKIERERNCRKYGKAAIHRPGGAGVL